MDLQRFLKHPIWRPNESCGTTMKKFMNFIAGKYNIQFCDYWELHKWSINNINEFWAGIWDFFGVIYSKTYDQVVDLNVPMADSPRWFEGARLNFAENILKCRDDTVALIVAGENRDVEYVTFKQMYEEAKIYCAALKKFGLKKGDTVACYMSNRKEAIIAMLGVTSIGAIWTGGLPTLGPQAFLNRVKQVHPRLLFTVDQFPQNKALFHLIPNIREIAEGLPSLEKVIIVPSKPESKLENISQIRNSFLVSIPLPNKFPVLPVDGSTYSVDLLENVKHNYPFCFLWMRNNEVLIRSLEFESSICCFLEEFLQSAQDDNTGVPDITFEQVSFSHPVFINYTSGTTGLPKTIVHGFGGLLTGARDYCLHFDSQKGDSWLSISAVGWVSWNFLSHLLFVGHTLVVFEGIPYFLSPTYLWDIIDQLKITTLFVSPTVLDDLEAKGYLPTEKHHLTSLKMIQCGGSVVKPNNYDFVFKTLKKVLAVGCGSTEMMGFCLTTDNSLPMYKGEISAPCLGIEVEILDESGQILHGEMGEFAISKPVPSLPLGFWGDPDGELFRNTYFSKHKEKFTIGDAALISPVTKGIIMCGRSDETLKPKGCRFGSSEIYNVIKHFPEIKDSLCVAQYSKKLDERAVLFIQMQEKEKLHEGLIQRLREKITQELTVRHIPEIMLEVPEIPYNANGKKMEIIVKKIINNLPHNPETVYNSECLKYYRDLPQLQGY